MTVNTTTGAMNEAEDMGGDSSDAYENVDASLSFDSFDDEDMDKPVSSFDDMDSEDDEDEETEGKGREEKLGSEELKLLNDSDGKGKKAEKKEDKDEEDSEDEDADSDDSDETPAKTEDKSIAESKGDGKKLRIKIGDEHFSLDSNAKMKVKVDGQNEEVSVQDLINNYSGKVAYDKKFTEIGSKNKELQQKQQQLEYEKETVIARFKPIMDKLKDPLADPFEALELLVDISGQDSYAFYKKAMEARLDELVTLGNMSESEQAAYFLKKQNERLLKSNEKRNLSEQEIQRSNQLRSQVDKLREAHGVSVDQYSEAFEELKRLPNSQNFTHEHVVDWASLKPILPQVEEILAPFVEEIDDSDYSGIVTSLGRSLRDGKLSKEQIQKIVKSEYGVSSEVKELNTKLNIGKGKVPKKEESKSEKIESFDDLEDD